MSAPVARDKRNKVVDHSEVARWMDEGRPYSWMVEEYRRKYNVATTIAMWSNYRKRHGFPRRLTRSNQLIPWEVRREHRWAYPVAMLRLESRRRRGVEMTEVEAARLSSFMESLDETECVVHYDPETEEGFFLIPREPHDEDIIRRPARADGREWDGD